MAEHEPPPSTSSKREAPAVPSPQPSAESDRGRRARRKAQIREKTAEEARRRRKVQVEEVGGRSEVVNQLDHTGETRQDAPAKKWDAETRASQGGILPTTKPEPIPPKLVQDLTRIGAQVAKVHSAALQRFQKILDG
ncbi:MAG TPA: hypothetical protein VFA18_03620, partial [Gemmataceae bacterium]|nr:hypothetical protein [Gemmataceae bacterium]